MSHHRYHRCLLFVMSLLVAPSIRAEPAQPPVTFAVVIGNNRSLGARRPDLHYADDDAARYFELLQTMAPGNVFLLADFDRDTAVLFPQTRPTTVMPTRAALQRVGADLAQKVRAAAAAGRTTQLYFVFAGHGDVDQGLGFIELSDARFTSSDLEAWLKQIPFSRAHVILDSCNSFFMLGVRKPGGRHFATPEDNAKALASRLPNVGVFLSTSAEGESFEWSELQSGIFSHVVRSGLLGAADANGDGKVSYVELAGFVETATADVRNTNMRPHIFARGPFALEGAPIVELSGRTGARRFRLSDAQPLRIRLRDREGLPLLDANAEAATPLSLVLPETWAKGAMVERADRDDQGPTRLSVYAVPEQPDVIELASLAPLPSFGNSRGPAEVFQSLFARPYGPRALSAYVAAKRVRPPEVYGVSHEDTARMGLVLTEIERADRNQRLLEGIGLLGTGVVVGVSGATQLQFRDRLENTTRKQAYTIAGVDFGLAALSVLWGGYKLIYPSIGEQAALDFRRVVAEGGDTTQAFARADARLQELLVRERRARWQRGIIGGATVLLSSAVIVGSELDHTPATERNYTRIFGGFGVTMGGMWLASAFLIESPVERLTRIWQSDPSLVQFHPTVIASDRSVLFGVNGTF
jgi:hypothetical protein